MRYATSSVRGRSLVGLLAALVSIVPAIAGAAEPSRGADAYALLAGSTLRTRGLRVAGGDVGVDDGILRATGRIDAPTSALVASVVDLDPRSQCAALFAGTADGAVPGCGPAAPFSGSIVPDLAASCGFPELPSCASGTAVHVGHGETRRLDPGTYADVAIQGAGDPGRLVLAGGDYVLCSLRAARNAEIDVQAPSRLFVGGAVGIGQSATVQLADGLAPRDLGLFAGGMVTFGRASRVAGHLCAPTSIVRIVDGAKLTGSFVADMILAGRIDVDLGSPAGPTTTTTTSTSTTRPSTSTTTVPTTTLPSSSTSTTSTTSTVPTTSATTRPTTTSTTTTNTSTTTTSSTTTTTIGTCTQGTTQVPFVVSFAIPDSSVLVQGLTVLVDYPETKVTIPGTGTATSVRQAIVNVQSGAISQPNDLDYALRDNLAGTAHALVPGSLFTINFFTCVGAAPATAADFTCTVEVATDPFGLPDDGVTCTVSAP